MNSSLPFRAARKLVSLYERRREYAEREKIWQYTFRTESKAEAIFLLVTAGSYLKDAAWAAASFLSHSAALAQRTKLAFCLHGLPDPRELTLLRETFVDAEIVSAKEILDRLGLPRLSDFAAQHPLGGKLAALTFYGETHSVFYSDSDVLAFGPVPEVETALFQGQAAYIAQSELGCYDKPTAVDALTKGYTLPAGLNSGLLVAPAGTFEPQVVESLVPAANALNPNSATWWWVEQTVVAAVMGKCQAVPLPSDRYVVSLVRQWPFEADVDYRKIAVRHFISPVRHLMYAKGIPFLLAGSAQTWKRMALGYDG